MTKDGIRVASIAAVAENGVIGRAGGMPWHIPSEYTYFRDMTIGKPVIMGRKSFDALGKPLRDRPNLVVTRDAAWRRDGVITCPTVEDAIAAARRIAAGRGAATVFIAGGAEIYRQAMPLIDTLYLTEVHLQPEGDVFFPDFDRGLFTETKRVFYKARPGDEADYTITVLERA
jgi:dihydrofolate reductase